MVAHCPRMLVKMNWAWEGDWIWSDNETSGTVPQKALRISCPWQRGRQISMGRWCNHDKYGEPEVLGYSLTLSTTMSVTWNAPDIRSKRPITAWILSKYFKCSRKVRFQINLLRKHVTLKNSSCSYLWLYSTWCQHSLSLYALWIYHHYLHTRYTNLIKAPM